MTEKALKASDADPMDEELRNQLEKIRQEEIPERLLDLARQLQLHLREKQDVSR